MELAGTVAAPDEKNRGVAAVEVGSFSETGDEICGS